MTLPASQANQFTNDSIALNSETDVNNEIFLAEKQIRNVGGRGFFKLSFNATIIGNPVGDPHTTTLSTDQQSFFDHFIDNGYVVGVDPDNGWWLLDWSDVGVEILTTVYSVRTTVTPGAIETQTITTINNYFAGLTPVALSTANLVNINGGDIPESDFGAPDSVFYEYIVLVQQQDDTDHAAGLKAALRASGLGYVDDTRVTGVGTSGNSTSPTNTVDISNGATTVTVTVGGTGTATDLVTAINNNTTLQAIDIIGDINGPDVLIVNELAGTLTVTNNVGDVLGDLFGLGSPQAGVLTDNTEVYLLT